MKKACYCCNMHQQILKKKKKKKKKKLLSHGNNLKMLSATANLRVFLHKGTKIIYIPTLRKITHLIGLVTFPCGILDQVWYLIASVPDLCLLSYFDEQYPFVLGSTTFAITEWLKH